MPHFRVTSSLRSFDKQAIVALLAGSAALGIGCSASDDDSKGSGGNIARGGSVATGGAPGSSGGSSTMGGATGGAATGSGGKSAGGMSNGGATGSGGASASGGSVASGGRSADGGWAGAATSGGRSASGGSSPASGGSTAAGGSAGFAASGGRSANGGSSPASGGRTAAGGSGNGGSGGAQPAGGTANGGTTAKGGSTGTGGTINVGNVTTACPGAVPTGTTATWCSCEQWGEKASGDHTYYNDIWGSGAGPQCIWLADSGMWGVASKHPNTSGIKSYPNISLSPKKVISAINTYSSSFDVLVPSGGAYEAAYDIWVKGTTSSRIEIMLWVTYHGNVQPIAQAYDGQGAVADTTNVSVGGHTWNVYYGSNGSNDVVSFLRTENTNTGTIDIKAVLAWIIANNKTKFGVFSNSATLDQVQFGYEITSDSNTQAYVTKSFSVTSN